MAARVLITRPSDRGDDLCAALRARGCDVAHHALQRLYPVAFTVPVSEPAPWAVVVASPSAVSYGATKLTATWRFTCSVVAVGQTTANAMHADGWRNVHVPETENSEQLLQLPIWADVAGKRIVLLRGEVGRDVIANELQRRGAHVESVVVYGTEGPSAEDVAAIQRWVETPGAIVISSAFALSQLCAIVSPPQRVSLRLLCLGPRLCALAQQQFSQVSEQVSEIASLDAITISEA